MLRRAEPDGVGRVGLCGAGRESGGGARHVVVVVAAAAADVASDGASG
jgi:hypothetical protein